MGRVVGGDDVVRQPRSPAANPSNVARFFSALELQRPIFAAVTASKREGLSEPDFELDSMFAEVSTVASLIGQMHWTLLVAGRPAFISSDHPITPVLWSNQATQTVGAPDVLMLGSSEVRLPVGPRAALLFTWHDADDRVETVPAAAHHGACSTRRRGSRPNGTVSGSRAQAHAVSKNDAPWQQSPPSCSVTMTPEPVDG